jgi:broad specificity phosphatase PhoE
MRTMSTLYMIRHGQASFGKSDYDKLSEKGERQAEYLAEYLHKE